MRLGLSSIVGDGFGTGSFGVDGPLTPPSFPPAGSYNSTLFGETYPTAEGGTSFADPTNGANPPIPNQIVDVDVLNDGSGGTYIDWSSATNVQYKANGTVFLTESSLPLNIEVPSGSGFSYQGGTYDNQYYHNGTGGWYSGGVNQSYYSNGTDTNIENLSGGDHQTEVPSGSLNYFSNGQFDGYTWDGSGGYNFPVTKGAYYTSGTQIFHNDNTLEVPSGSGMYFQTGTYEEYQWDGFGGYLDTSGGSYHSYGTYIYNDGSFDYYWDGNGGYYI